MLELHLYKRNERNLSLSAVGSHALSLLVSGIFGDHVSVVVALIGSLKELNINLGHGLSSTGMVKVSSLAVDLNIFELRVEPSIQSLALNISGIDDSLGASGGDLLVVCLMVRELGQTRH